MKLWFLPFVREGVTPVAAASTATARPQTRITMRLAAPGRQARDIGRSLELLGPGDVVGIEPRPGPARDAGAGLARCRARFLPVGGVRCARTAVDLQPRAARRNAPASVDRAGGDRGAARRARGSRAARTEPVDPAHAGGRGAPRTARARRTPGPGCTRRWPATPRTRSRPRWRTNPIARWRACLSPRRLLPNRDYHACVVPTYLAGRLAGLGGNPATNPLVRTGREPAWSATRHARRVAGLSHVDFPHRRGRRFRIARAASAADAARCVDSGTAAADRDAGRTRRRLGTAAARARAARRNDRGDRRPPCRRSASRSRAARRPRPCSVRRTSARRGPTSGRSSRSRRWAPELNLTPMWRAAAGLGAEAVRGEQEALVAAASEQFEAYRRAQSEGRRKQFAATVVNRVKPRLATGAGRPRACACSRRWSPSRRAPRPMPASTASPGAGWCARPGACVRRWPTSGTIGTAHRRHGARVP